MCTIDLKTIGYMYTNRTSYRQSAFLSVHNMTQTSLDKSITYSNTEFKIKQVDKKKINAHVATL